MAELREGQMEWISVEERLPPEREMVLLFCPGTRFTKGQFHIGRWESNKQWWLSEEGQAESTKNWFTHWMPLPEPPEYETITIIINVSTGEQKTMTVDELTEYMKDAIRQAYRNP